MNVVEEPDIIKEIFAALSVSVLQPSTTTTKQTYLVSVFISKNIHKITPDKRIDFFHGGDTHSLPIFTPKLIQALPDDSRQKASA